LPTTFPAACQAGRGTPSNRDAYPYRFCIAGAVRLPVQQPRESGVLIGLTGNELVTRFGRPVLQIKEGNSFKLQFRGNLCVLDAFLYPSTGSQYRVTHVETRSRAGIDTNQSDCIRTLEYPG
jgi:hypothetical protein